MVALAVGCVIPSLAPRAHVQGTLHVVNADAGDPALGPAVVYLAPGSASAAFSRRSGSEPARVRHAGRGFEPALIALGPGQRVVIENASGLHHQVFWLRDGARFEVELGPESGATQSIDPGEPGVARFYCELHADEHFAAHVAPTPHFALLDAPGDFELSGVPAGAWRLAIWSEAVEGRIREIRLAPSERSRQDVWIDASQAARRSAR